MQAKSIIVSGKSNSLALSGESDDSGAFSVAALFVREDSSYKDLSNVDAYDFNRDATKYKGRLPVVAHPPCRAWGKLATLKRVKPRPGEKELAFFALEQIHKNGGVLEHPHGSRLWKAANLPEPGNLSLFTPGFSLLIDQWDFGHVARKPTKIYIYGCSPEDLPPLPVVRGGVPLRSISGEVAGTVCCTRKQREYTPIQLRDWLVAVALRCALC
jgi:hypothetical protein